MDRLVSELDPCGEIGNAVKKAVRAVPRHQFIPTVGLVVPTKAPPYMINRDDDPVTWWDTVYSDSIVVTQLMDGAVPLYETISGYTSSASAPSTVADLLNLLDPDPGQRVLEIATGTGWTGALLCHLVGERGQVTSIEIDPAIADQAAKNLAGAGATPTLIVGDGALGWPPGAPYDRVHVTCGVRTLPYTWIEQCRPGATIVLPYCPNFGANHSLRLVVLPDGAAVGRFPGFASYMMLRSQRPVSPLDARGPEERHLLRTRVDPRTIAYAPAGADLAMAALTGLEASHSSESDEDGELFKLWICDPRDPYSWATAVWRPNSVEYDVYQVGHRPVWDEVLNAYFQWVSWGRPGRDRFGMTVTPHGQRIWLDSPDRIVG
ncbi:protein-L-isoaspartate(D-aspartate) O-methyltransferase [Nonomuraea terrae]|uniref:Protein-L-isoaspartate O-methyltransferase n=1 Tax=Nonomuraea terrae TaxID=2530383 RepID=A0A4R4YMP3_9ACTN|nr:protein-L-isoaspartate(D-aspartate) O-methyltransferase [Nonomuraea terrae]TDD46263.1 protein-L-isoaspartate(D-aspartate) O-methyltransferase [Nonomuraea terrae]